MVANNHSIRNMTPYAVGYVYFLNGADFCDLPEVAEVEMGWLAAEAAMTANIEEKDDLTVGDGYEIWSELDECGFGEDPIYGDAYHGFE